MSFNNFGLGFVFSGVDRVSGTALKVNAVLQEVAKSSDSLSAKLRDPATGKFLGRAAVGKMFERDASMVTAGVATMGAGIAGLAGAFRAANIAGEFEQGLAGLSAVAKATDEEMKLARDAVIKAGMETQFSPTEALAGMQQLVTAGQTIQDSAKTLIPVMDLAAGSLGNLSVEGAADAIIGTMNSYQMSADQATGVTNKLLRITQLTNFATNDFAGALAKAASNGAMFGTELDDVLITIGLLRNANIDASSAGTGFRESIRRVATMPAQQDKLKALGIETYDEMGKMRSIVEIINDTVTAYQKVNTRASATERDRALGLIFGSRGLLAYNAIMRSSYKTMKDGTQVEYQGIEAVKRMRAESYMAGGEIEKLRDLTKDWADHQEIMTRALTEGGKTAQEFKEKLLDTYKGQKQLLSGILETIVIQIGEPLSKALKPIVRSLANMFTSLAGVIEGMDPALKSTIAKMLAVTFAVMAVAGAVVAMRFGFVAFRATLGMVGMNLKSIVSAFMRLNMWARVITIGAYLAYKAYKTNFGGMASTIKRVITTVKLLGQAIYSLFSEGGFSGPLLAEINRAENAGIKKFAIEVYAIGMRVVAFFEGFIDALKEGWTEIGPVVMEAAQAIKEAILAVMEAFGFMGGASESASNTSMSSWREWGAMFGRLLIFSIKLLAILVKWIGKFASILPWGIILKTVVAWKALGFVMWNGIHAYLFMAKWIPIVAGKFMIMVDILKLVGMGLFNIARMLLANPVVLIAAAVAIAAYLIWQNWDWIVENVWEPFKEWILYVAGLFSNVSFSWEGMKNLMLGIWEILKNTVFLPWKLIIMGIGWVIKRFFPEAWETVTAFFHDKWMWMKDNIWQPFLNFLNDILGKIDEVIEGAKNLPGIRHIRAVGGYAADAIFGASDGLATVAAQAAADQGATVPATTQASANKALSDQAMNEALVREIGIRGMLDTEKREAAEKRINARLAETANRPIVVQIDGSTIATATQNYSAKNEELSFGPEENQWSG